MDLENDFSTCVSPSCPKVERNADILMPNRPLHHRDTHATTPPKKIQKQHSRPRKLQRASSSAQEVDCQATITQVLFSTRPFHHSSSAAAAAAVSLPQHPSLPLPPAVARPGIVSSSSSSSMPSERTPRLRSARRQFVLSVL